MVLYAIYRKNDIHSNINDILLIIHLACAGITWAQAGGITLHFDKFVILSFCYYLCISMIKYLEIQGYKSIQNLEIGLQAVNVLIGANGVGKSNLISFFKLLKAISNQQLQRFVLEEGKADDLLYFGRKHTETLSGKLIFSNNLTSNNAYIFELNSTKSGGLFIHKEASGFDVSVDDDSTNYIYHNDFEESKILNGFSKNNKNEYLKKYFSGIQIYHFHDTSSESRLRRSCDVEDNKQLKSDGRNLPAVLYLLL